MIQTLLEKMGLYTRRYVQAKEEYMWKKISDFYDEQNKAPDILYDSDGKPLRKFYGEFGIVFRYFDSEQ